jgi:hypothetical protein
MEKEKSAKELAREKALKHTSAFSGEYKKQVSTAIITAFGLVIALAWKDVVTAILPSITAPGFLVKYPVIANLYSAVIITSISVLGIVLISRWLKPSETK